MKSLLKKKKKSSLKGYRRGMRNPFILFSSASHTACLLVGNRGKWFVWSRHEGGKNCFCLSAAMTNISFFWQLGEAVEAFEKGSAYNIFQPNSYKIHRNTNEQGGFNCISWSEKLFKVILTLSLKLQPCKLYKLLHFWDCVESLGSKKRKTVMIRGQKKKLATYL